MIINSMEEYRITVTKRLSDDEKKKRVLKFISLRFKMSSNEAERAVQLSRDTIYKYAKQFGLEREIMEASKTPVVRRKKS